MAREMSWKGWDTRGTSQSFWTEIFTSRASASCPAGCVALPDYCWRRSKERCTSGKRVSLGFGLGAFLPMQSGSEEAFSGRRRVSEAAPENFQGWRTRSSLFTLSPLPDSPAPPSPSLPRSLADGTRFRAGPADSVSLRLPLPSLTSQL